MGCRWSEVQILSPRPIKSIRYSKSHLHIAPCLAIIQFRGRAGGRVVSCLQRPLYEKKRVDAERREQVEGSSETAGG